MVAFVRCGHFQETVIFDVNEEDVVLKTSLNHRKCGEEKEVWLNLDAKNQQYPEGLQTAKLEMTNTFVSDNLVKL